MDKSLERKLLKATSILYAEDDSGEREQASCFFVSAGKEGKHHFLVTNKHVLENKTKIHVYMDLYHKEDSTYTRHKKLTLRLNDTVRYHPDYDLAALCIDGVAKLNTEEQEYQYSAIEADWIPDSYEDFSAFQEILMLGYPSGIGDMVSNFPVTRKGMTATPVWNCYKGQPNFLIDIPFLSGSSGSPIFAEADGKVWLLGIECSTIMEKMVEECLPNRLYRSRKKTVEVETGLGLAVRSDQLHELLYRNKK